MVITNLNGVILEICNNVVYLKKNNKGDYVRTDRKSVEAVQSDQGNIYEWGRKKINPSFYDVFFVCKVEEVPEEVEPLKYVYDEINGFRKYEGQITYTEEELSEKTDIVQVGLEETNLNISGNFDPNKIYNLDEYCLYNNNLYRFSQNIGRGIYPTNKLYWTMCDIATELNKLATLIKEK